MENLIYSAKLARRFVSDYKLPIPITNRQDFFFYYLDLFEKHNKSMEKYKKLVELVEEKFDGNPDKFLEDYQLTRDKIIMTILESESYKKFNTGDMGKYVIKNHPNVSSNNIYNYENIGKRFLSVDLKRANYQTLNYVNKDILLQTSSYEEFIEKFTDIYYIKESKYTRQVIFGKLNPKRTITVEKYITNLIREKLNLEFDLVSMSNDELVYNIPLDSEIDIEEIRVRIPEFKLNIEDFILKGYKLKPLDENKPGKLFFTKGDDLTRLITIPIQFYPLAYKLLSKLPLCDVDYHITYEEYDAILNEKFYVQNL